MAGAEGPADRPAGETHPDRPENPGARTRPDSAAPSDGVRAPRQERNRYNDRPLNAQDQAELRRIPAHPPTPQGYASQAPQRYILMTPHMTAIGGLLAFFTVVMMVVVLPTATYNPPPSQNWLPISNAAHAGRGIFIANGCVYCHSGFSRPQDVFNANSYLYPRVSEPGDYHGVSQSPNLMGSERTGPDLSQEGGSHPDDWHAAHYLNPRNTTPLSIMPQFGFLSQDDLNDLIAFAQSQGDKEATLRYAAETVGKKMMGINGAGRDPAQLFPTLVKQLQQSGEYRAGGAASDSSPSGLPWMAVWMLNSFERSYWLTKDPLPVTPQNLIRGKAVYVTRCIGCHGQTGNGSGPAAQYLAPSPFAFNDPGPMGINGPFASDGDLYHRILTAGKGTAMENFGTRLSVEDIWRVVLFLRTIQNGSLKTADTLPTSAMFQSWEPPPVLMAYVDTHPINQGPGNILDTAADPFMAAAHWVAPGLGTTDTVLVGGKLPITLDRLADLIRNAYTQMVEKDYDDAVARGEDLPPKEQIMSTSDLVFHAP